MRSVKTNIKMEDERALFRRGFELFCAGEPRGRCKAETDSWGWDFAQEIRQKEGVMPKKERWDAAFRRYYTFVLNKPLPDSE